EGRAMAQLVHGIAPGASLLFADAGSSAYVMADRIRALVAAGADIVVDDISFYNVPGFQEGPIDDAIAEAVAAGVGYYTSAGHGAVVSADTGRQIASWATAAFAAADCPLELGGTVGNTGCLNFGTDLAPDVTNRITVSRSDSGDVVLGVLINWEEPWY